MVRHAASFEITFRKRPHARSVLVDRPAFLGERGGAEPSASPVRSPVLVECTPLEGGASVRVAERKSAALSPQDLPAAQAFEPSRKARNSFGREGGGNFSRALDAICGTR